MVVGANSAITANNIRDKYMDTSKLVSLHKVVIAIEDLSWLYPQWTELYLEAGKDYLVGVSYKTLLAALKILEGEYGIIKIVKEELNANLVHFTIVDYNYFDSWGRKIRHDEGEIEGEKKVWGKLIIAMDRSWLRYDGEKINVNLNHKSILLLLRLIDAKGAIVDYKELANAVNLSSNYEDQDKSVLSYGLKVIKRDLAKYLIDNGLSEVSANSIKNMITAAQNQGYHLKQEY